MTVSDEFCVRFESATMLLGKKWTPLLLKVLLAGPRRFGAFHAAVPQLSDRMLSERLKELEEAGLVTRQAHEQVPVCVTYALTDKGRDLAPVIAALQAWAHRWVDNGAQPGTSGAEAAAAAGR